MSGNVESLNSDAANSLGVTQGGNAQTGIQDTIGSGSVGKGAAATVSNQSNDELATLEGTADPTHPDIPPEKLDETVSNATALRMEALNRIYFLLRTHQMLSTLTKKPLKMLKENFFKVKRLLLLRQYQKTLH